MCVTASGPRTCVFRVGGTITLQSDIIITEPYLTIAGQTAPGGGIQFPRPGILIQAPAHDIIVRYIRHRRGWEDMNRLTDKGFGDIRRLKLRLQRHR